MSLEHAYALIVLVAIVLVAMALHRREARSRRQTQAELHRKHDETTLLLQAGELLQASRSVDEACVVISQFAPRFFDAQPGSLYLFNPGRTALEERSAWGDRARSHGDHAFSPEDCWALRRAQLHWYDGTTVNMPCTHLGQAAPRSALCLPLLVHGEVLGILHLTSAAPLGDDVRQRTALLGEHLGLALANLSLRETLRDQSIRDPLTGLFNRRYTEETLDREIHRAARGAEALAVLMLDVDHFKRFNDTFGRDAGDQVLCEIGKLLKAHTRASDMVSRMGGEELLVVLPGARGDEAERKAQELRAEIAKLRIVHGGRDLGEVTISVGVALHPQHGNTAVELLRVADTALAAAKREGRDRVIVAA